MSAPNCTLLTSPRAACWDDSPRMSPLAPDKRAVLAIMPQSCPRLVSVKSHVALAAKSGVLPQRSWFLERSRYGRLASFAGIVPVSALLLRLISSSFCSFPQLAGSWPERAHSTRGSHCNMVSVGRCALFGKLASRSTVQAHWQCAQTLALEVPHRAWHAVPQVKYLAFRPRPTSHQCALVQPASLSNYHRMSGSHGPWV